MTVATRFRYWKARRTGLARPALRHELCPAAPRTDRPPSAETGRLIGTQKGPSQRGTRRDYLG
jgi:hypothetical protein